MSLQIKASRISTQGGIPMSMVVRGGDPGLFGFLGKAIGGVAKLAGKVLPGPIGTVAGGIGGLLAGRASTRQTPGISAVATPPITRQDNGFRLPLPGPTSVQVRPTAVLPGGRPFTTTVADPMRGAPSTNGGPAPSGFHWNKSDYFLRDGTFVAKGTRLVKNRRRNPLNPRALDRALGRVGSAKKAASKLSRVTIRKAKC